MTRQVSYGTIHDHEITVKIQGPEAQDIPEGDERVGSDELMARVESLLAELKADVEGGDDDRPEFEGQRVSKGNRRKDGVSDDG